MVPGWKMPFLERQRGCRSARSRYLLQATPTKEQFYLGRKGLVTLIAAVLGGWKLG